MRRRVVVAPPRRGPGLIGTMARTAVIAGTATATANAVNSRQAAGQQAAAQQQAAQQQLAAQQAQIEALQTQQLQAQVAAQQAPAQVAAPTGLTDEKIAQLKKLAELQQAGILTEEEFATQKARILGS